MHPGVLPIPTPCFPIATFLVLTNWQAKRESNPQPPVLETGALPIELLAFSGPGAKCQVLSGVKSERSEVVAQSSI